MELLVFFGYLLINIIIYILGAIVTGFGIAAGFEGWKTFQGWYKNRKYIKEMNKEHIGPAEAAAGAEAT